MALRLAVAAALVALALWYGLTHSAAATQQQAQIDPAAAAAPADHQWLGAGGCASMGCHNANGVKGQWRSEYTTWILHDPHARAYEVLFNPKSRSIAKNLQPNGGKAAHELPLCLNCHVHKDYDQANHHSRFAKEDGVSCESCHGPAGGWISDHYKPSWGGLSPREKNARGMWDTGSTSLAGRVQSCTPCHVGAAGMDVNHDLIAAGHPRLAFEFSAYHDLMPHHWQDDKDRKPGVMPRARDDWDAAAWFVGEAVTTKAALELLSARAGTTVWPEFAEYDCYACHHQLQNQGWRQDPKRQFGIRKAGSLPWSEWYVNPLPYQLFSGKPESQGLPKEIDKLRAMMQDKAFPNRAAVRQQAAAAIKDLQVWIKQAEATRYPRGDLAGILGQLAADGAKDKATSWDAAAQRYLAVVAIHQALRDASAATGQPEVTDAMRRIRSLLQFAPNVDSPSPGYTPDLLLEPYGVLRQKLGRAP